MTGANRSVTGNMRPLTIAHETSFVQIGTRDYVQGVVILIEALRLATAATGSDYACVRRVKFTRRALANGTMTLIVGEMPIPIPADHDAWIEGEIAGRNFRATMKFDDARPVIDAVPDETHAIAGLTATGAYSAKVDVDAPDGPRFLKAMIEANKRAIQMSLPPAAGKPRVEFVDAQGIGYSAEAMSMPGPVAIENVSARAFGARRYVLNRIRYRSGTGAPADFFLNYSVHIE